MAGNDSISAGVPGRYATALFELAEEAGSLDEVANDLSGLRAMLDDSADLARMVRSPVYSADEQSAALTALLSKAGASELTINFFKLVAKNRRLFAVGGMIAAFRALLARHRGEVSADVTSAAPLSDQQTEALKSALKAALGQDVQMETRVDPAILGGLVVKVGSRMIDSSIRTKLNNLKVAMKEVG